MNQRPFASALALAALVAATLGAFELLLGGEWRALHYGARSVAALATAAEYALVGLALGGLALASKRAAEAQRLGLAAGLGACAAILLGDHFGWTSRALAFAAGGGLLAFVLFRETLLAYSGVSKQLARPGAWAGLCALLFAALFLGDTPRAQPTAATPARSDQPSLLLVTIDTLRADHLGAYGYRPARTPVFDRLANEGFRFDAAVSPSVLTGPAHATVMTGLTPDQHGVSDNAMLARDDLVLLPDLALRKGLQTAAFVAGGPVTQEALGILDHFTDYDDDFRTFKGLPQATYSTALGRLAARALYRFGFQLRAFERPADAVNASVLAWLDGADERPAFVWVHYYDPHLPYEPPARLLSPETRAYRGPALPDLYPAGPEERARMIADPEALAHMRQLYDAEIAHVDERLGELVERTRAKFGDALWVVVTADHGESFGEHEIYYGRDLYEPTTHVPLVIRPPEALATGQVVSDVVGLVDLAATVAEILGLDAPAGSDGRSLLPAMRGEALAPASLHSLRQAMAGSPFTRRHEAIRRGPHKAIRRNPGWNETPHDWRAEERELYDLSADPAERRNLAPERPALFEELMSAAPRPGARQERRELDEEQRNMLEALGYIE